MSASNYVKLLLLFVCFNNSQLFCRDILLEFKGAYFLPTNSTFRDAYKGTGAFGPEFTVQFRNESNWYGFLGLDYFKVKGKHLKVADSTTVRFLPLVFGLKYFMPFCCDRADFYLGLGAQAVHIKKKLERACVIQKDKFWSGGFRAKMGAYINLKCNFLLDLFADYSFLRTKKMHFYGPTTTCCKANLSGLMLGLGLTYRFSL